MDGALELVGTDVWVAFTAVDMVRPADPPFEIQRGQRKESSQSKMTEFGARVI
jgi:hypothetical protein